MPAPIPSNINGVLVEFHPNVVNSVDQRLIDALRHVIHPGIAPGHMLQRIYIRSVSDSHAMPSRHAQQKAVDISRFNGIHVQGGYSSNPSVRAFVDSIQEAFEECNHRRENFGPLFNRRHGQPWAVGGHNDHIHLSVD
jgi:hypothetical protein